MHSRCSCFQWNGTSVLYTGAFLDWRSTPWVIEIGLYDIHRATPMVVRGVTGQVPRPITKSTLEDLRTQGSALHSSDCFSGHGVPPCAAWMVTVKPLVRVPPPHSSEHSDQSPHVTLQSTGSGGGHKQTCTWNPFWKRWKRRYCGHAFSNYLRADAKYEHFKLNWLKRPRSFFLEYNMQKRLAPRHFQQADSPGRINYTQRCFAPMFKMNQLYFPIRLKNDLLRCSGDFNTVQLFHFGELRNETCCNDCNYM